jgi:hypothetical protein
MSYQFVDRAARLRRMLPVLSRLIAAEYKAPLPQQDADLKVKLADEFSWLLNGYQGDTNWRAILQKAIHEERTRL